MLLYTCKIVHERDIIMKPIIKYRGGKTKEIPLFQQFIPNDYDRYIEPFVGGGAVYFHLAPQNSIINDLNTKLVNFYTCIQNHYPIMRRQLDEIQNIYESNQRDYEVLKALHPEERVENRNEELYYQLRDMFNETIPQNYLDGVLYFFINKTAYSGMVRYNRNGQFNVPFGRYKNLNTQIITDDHHALIQRTQIFNLDYSQIFNMTNERDFMFLDPPYDCVFNDYGNIELTNGFNEQEHRRLANDFRNLHCNALMVIGRTPLTEELYGNFICHQYPVNYAVNIRNRFDTTATHIVVKNY